MSPVKLTIHAIEAGGVCCLSGREGEMLIVSFEDGTLTEGALSQKSLLQLLRMKLQQNGKGPTTELPAARPVDD